MNMILGTRARLASAVIYDPVAPMQDLRHLASYNKHYVVRYSPEPSPDCKLRRANFRVTRLDLSGSMA